MDRRARAIERVYRTRYEPFRIVLATVTGSEELAREAVQEGFARALASRSQFRGDLSQEGALEAWIWRITIRAALESRANGSQLPLGHLIDPVLVSSEQDPALAEAVRALPPRRRFIVFLRYFADLSYQQIASVCGISEGTVAASLVQAREAMRVALEADRSSAADDQADPVSRRQR